VTTAPNLPVLVFMLAAASATLVTTAALCMSLLVRLALMRLLMRLILVRLLMRLVLVSRVLMRIFTRLVFMRFIRTRLIFVWLIRALVVCPLVVIRPLFRTRIPAVLCTSVPRWRCMAEIARPRRCRISRPPVVHGCELRPVLRRRMLVLHLRRSCLNVMIVLRRHFSLRRTRVDSPSPAVKAHVTRVIYHYGPVICVVNDVHVHVAVSAVVSKYAVVPIAALVANAHVPEAIVNAAVEADVRSPVPRMPQIHAVTPTPISRRPQETNLRRHHPRAWYPVIIVTIPRPIPGRPNVPITRARWLRIHRQGRRTHSYRDAHANLSLRGCWHTQHCKSENECKEQ
jgi:hypothetical protein